MDLTNEEAQALIDLPKKIMVAEQPLDEYIMRFSEHVDDQFDLISDDGNLIFCLAIHQREQNHLKITLHFQDNSKFIGLLRIDYNGSHKNPKILNANVPSFAVPFADTVIKESHAHFYVQGYKPLAWAIPLSSYDFEVKDIFDSDSSFVQAVQAFCRKINIVTHCDIEGRLFL